MRDMDLPKSPASLIPPSFKGYHRACHCVASSNGLVLIAGASDKACCYVGNPVLQQWVKIPPPSEDSFVFWLVTRVDEDSVVTSFKVVRLAATQPTNLSSSVSVLLYSSQTGIWTSKIIHCPRPISNRFYINLNGKIYFRSVSVLVSHDFYSDESDQFRVVQLPDHSGDDIGVIRTLTTSGGFVMYVRALAHKEETLLKIWRLNNDGESWQLLWEIGLPMIGEHAPMAMHPFDIGTVYLWSEQYHHVVSCNLRTRNYTILRDAYNDGYQDCFIDKSVDKIWFPRSLSFRFITWFVPFVLPRWMESVPRPPQAEMIDTTSLLSYVTST